MKKSFYAVSREVAELAKQLVDRFVKALESEDFSNYDKSKDELLRFMVVSAERSLAMPDESWESIQGGLHERDQNLRKVSAQILWTPEMCAQMAEGLGNVGCERDVSVLCAFLSNAASAGLSIVTLSE